MKTTTNNQQVNATSVLLPYALTLVVAMAAIQILIALTGGVPTLLSGILTAVVAVGIALWYWRHVRQLSKIRFGGSMAHAIAFAIITTSFNLHALIHVLVVGKAGGLEAAAHDLFSTPWFGTTLVMSSLWGLGLVLALLGSVLGRGWRD